MAEARFDELIHPSTRLSIVALLASADWIDFAFVRDRLGLSDSRAVEAVRDPRGRRLPDHRATAEQPAPAGAGCA